MTTANYEIIKQGKEICNLLHSQDGEGGCNAKSNHIHSSLKVVIGNNWFPAGHTVF